jgi:hypothetical protein
MMVVAYCMEVRLPSARCEARLRSITIPTIVMIMPAATGAYRRRMRRTPGWARSSDSRRRVSRNAGSCSSACPAAPASTPITRLVTPSHGASASAHPTISRL